MIEHFYKNIQGWFNYEKFYKTLVEQAKSGYTIVEVGSWKGMSAAYMGVEILNSGKNINFYCVDTWKGSEEHRDKSSPFYEPLLEKGDLDNVFLDNTEPVRLAITPLKKTSIEAAKLFKDNSVNCVFLDAAHDYDNIKLDIAAWLPKVIKGGILSGHDFYHPPINKALHEIFSDKVQYFGDDVWYLKV